MHLLTITCSSQVHEIHPSHAFLAVPDKPARSRSEPDPLPTLPIYPTDEQCRLPLITLGDMLLTRANYSNDTSWS